MLLIWQTNKLSKRLSIDAAVIIWGAQQMLQYSGSWTIKGTWVCAFDWPITTRVRFPSTLSLFIASVCFPCYQSCHLNAVDCLFIPRFFRAFGISIFCNSRFPSGESAPILSHSSCLSFLCWVKSAYGLPASVHIRHQIEIHAPQAARDGPLARSSPRIMRSILIPHCSDWLDWIIYRCC